jgi:hypothetical protein
VAEHDVTRFVVHPGLEGEFVLSRNRALPPAATPGVMLPSGNMSSRTGL